MSLKDRLKKNQVEGFQPLDLNDGNVNAIFNRCISVSSDPNSMVGTVLFPKEFGYQDQGNPVFFERKALETYNSSIKYLWGQLMSIHDSEFLLTIQDAMKKYDKTVWSSDPVTIMKFLHLGVATKNITIFSAANKNRANIVLKEPTLSPLDPNFSSWYEGYKKKHNIDAPTPDEK